MMVFLIIIIFLYIGTGLVRNLVDLYRFFTTPIEDEPECDCKCKKHKLEE